MKKTILKSLLLGAAALTAMTASANLTFEVADVEVEPGGATKNVTVFVTHEMAFSAIELHFALIDGITFDSAINPTTANMSDWPTYSYYDDEEEQTVVNQLGNISYNVDATANEFKVIVNCQANNNQGVVGYWPIGKTCVCRIKIKADANFTGAKLHLNYAKSDYSDPTTGAPPIGIEEASNLDVCNITVPVAGTPLADIVAQGVDNTEYTVLEDLHIVAKAPKANCVFVSDGESWMKVFAEGNVYTAIEAMDDIKGGTLKGVLSEANCNQKLTVTTAPTAATTPVVVEPTAWNLAQSDPTSAQYHFAPKVNEVIKLEGYWFDGEFRGYADNTGQSATADMSWCNTDATMTNGQLYKNVVSVAQLKAPWDSKVAADDDLAFQNYKVYPMAIEDNNVVTGVENLNGDKSVVSVQYVNVAGQVANTPFNGVNMVVTRYADGSTVTTKVIK